MDRALLAEDRLEEALVAYRKLRGEAEGYRDRLTRNVERRQEQRHEALLLNFIDILDNLDRALGAAQTSYAGDPLIDGLIQVRSQLLQTLQDEGLERIPVLGLSYDPHHSEAVGTLPVDDPEHHQLVVREMLRGYRLNGRVARPSRVLMGEYRPPASDVADQDKPAAAGGAQAGAAEPLSAAVEAVAKEPAPETPDAAAGPDPAPDTTPQEGPQSGD